MTQLNTDSINSQADNYAGDYATATFTLYAGTPPADANAPLSGNTVLAVHTFAGFAAAAGGVAVANAIADATFAASGTITFGRLAQGANITQATVGLAGSGADYIVSSTTAVAGGTSSVNSATATQPAE